MDTARRTKRYPSEQPLLVRCDTWHEFVELYAGDVGQGGMFILTQDPPPLMSSVDVRLVLPEATEILLRGRVVHVISQEHAQAEGKAPGAGIEFMDMDADRKRQIFQLVEFARWQGAPGVPGASYARTMLELSASMPPARISAAPGTSNPPGTRPSADRHTANPEAARTSATPASRRAAPNPDAAVAAPKDAKRSTFNGGDQRPGDGDPRKITLDGVQSSVHPEDQAFSLRPPTDSRRPEAKRSDSAARAREFRTSSPAAPSASPAKASEATLPGSAKSADNVELTVAMTHFAHRRYDQALYTLAKMLQTRPGDPQVVKWQHMCRARESLAENDNKSAAASYEQALALDENNREARDFVRNYRRDTRLNSLPFGRYFVKKK